MNIKRNINIDIIKGIGIILMVGGHCGMPFTHFIYLFHMAIFFIASGFCYKIENPNAMQSARRFIGGKFKSLWFPYVFWTAVFSFLHNFFIRIGIYTSDVKLMQQVANGMINVSQPWSFIEITKNIVKAFLLHGHTQLGSAFWFIATLMEISILYYIIDSTIKKIINKENIQFVIQTIISIIMLMIGYYCALTDSTWGGVNRVFSYYILFYIGTLLKQFYDAKSTTKYHYLKMIGSFAVLVICNQIGSIALDENQYKNPIFLLVTSICGWILMYEISFEVKKIKCITDFIVCCGRNSMAILILHFLCFKVVSLFGVIICKQSVRLIAAFPILYQNGMWWIAYMCAGIIIPVVLSLLWKRVKRKIGESYSMVN